jgi:hypothetical protein
MCLRLWDSCVVSRRTTSHSGRRSPPQGVVGGGRPPRWVLEGTPSLAPG